MSSCHPLCGAPNRVATLGPVTQFPVQAAWESRGIRGHVRAGHEEPSDVGTGQDLGDFEHLRISLIVPESDAKPASFLLSLLQCMPCSH